MDDSVILIAIVGSLLFFGVLIWKAVWLIRKVNESPDDASDPSTDRPSERSSDHP